MCAWIVPCEQSQVEQSTEPEWSRAMPNFEKSANPDGEERGCRVKVWSAGFEVYFDPVKEKKAFVRSFCH